MDEDEGVAALIGRLEAYLEVAAQRGTSLRPTQTKAVQDQLERQTDIIRQICNDVRPGLGDFEVNWTGYAKAQAAARTAIGLLTDRKAVDADLQQRIGRSALSDDQLVTYAFGSDASKQPRLHLPGDPETDTWKSRQQGLGHLGRAIVAGVRNPVAHDASHSVCFAVAVEQLAVLSLFAHWVDETVLVGPTDSATSSG
jgi:hypothetical protein